MGRLFFCYNPETVGDVNNGAKRIRNYDLSSQSIMLSKCLGEAFASSVEVSVQSGAGAFKKAKKCPPKPYNVNRVGAFKTLLFILSLDQR